MYAGYDVYGAGTRSDAIECKHEGMLRKGIIAMIVGGWADNVEDTPAFIAVRRIREIYSGYDFRKVVKVFGHRRYAHELQVNSPWDIVMDFIHSKSVCRLLFIVQDFHDFSVADCNARQAL